MVLANLVIIAILVIVGILNNRGDKPPAGNPLAMRIPPDWAKIAKSIDQMYQFNEYFPYVNIKRENERAEAEQLGSFRLEKNGWNAPFPNYSNWYACTSLDLPSSIEARWADSYVGIDYHSYYGKDEQFMSDVDSSVSVKIRKLPSGSFYSYALGYLDVSSAYSLAEIRAHVNPLLRQIGSRCRITGDGDIESAKK